MTISNYLPLHTKLQEDLTKLALYEFLWMGRLAAFKMLHLSQILYLFRTISIPIPSKYVKSLQTILSSFIWQAKKSRCRHMNLIKQRQAGGTDYVDFQDYYLASVLMQSKDWFPSPPSTLWGKWKLTWSQGVTYLCGYLLWLLDLRYPLYFPNNIGNT